MTAAFPDEIDFAPYRDLLAQLLLVPVHVALADLQGRPFWQDRDFPTEVLRRQSPALLTKRSGRNANRATVVPTTGFGSTCATVVSNDENDPVAVLWVMSRDLELREQDLGHIVQITNRLSREISLVAQLDALAAELSERYEELNLVYHTEDQVSYFSEGRTALNQLVRNCCDYLGVGLAAVIIDDKSILQSQQSLDKSIPDAQALTEFLKEHLYRAVCDGGSPIIVDDLARSTWSDRWRGRSYRLLATPIFAGNEKIVGVLAIANSLTKPRFSASDKNLLQVMARKANKILQVSSDTLTGLVNRQGLDAIAKELLDDSRACGTTHCILHVDIDQLHVVNDTLSHEAGDALIQAIAVYLRQCTRQTDVVCRIGGDELAVLLRRCPLERGTHLADELRRGIADLVVPWRDQVLTTTVTIGVAPIDPDTTSAPAAVAAAELACGAAKEMGKNRIHQFQHGDTMLVKRHHEMEAVGRIQMAIKEDRLTLVAQIIEPLRRESSRFHVEVLVRLRDIDGELILPGTFIPAAERYHLMPELDRWVIEKAFDMLEQSPRQSRQRFSMLSINLSGQALNEPDFGRWLTERLGRLQFPLERICFEITETAAVANLDEATAFMSAIKSYGCRFALDDVGSGLSSFGYLRSLPIDFLKIDGALVREIADDAVAASMVAAVQQVASVMNLQTVAEFVESERVKNVLDTIGVDFVQGYAIGRPKPLAEYLYRASSDSQALTA